MIKKMEKMVAVVINIANAKPDMIVVVKVLPQNVEMVRWFWVSNVILSMVIWEGQLVAHQGVAVYQARWKNVRKLLLSSVMMEPVPVSQRLVVLRVMLNFPLVDWTSLWVIAPRLVSLIKTICKQFLVPVMMVVLVSRKIVHRSWNQVGIYRTLATRFLVLAVSRLVRRLLVVMPFMSPVRHVIVEVFLAQRYFLFRLPV
jgi:hypothetical protein